MSDEPRNQPFSAAELRAAVEVATDYTGPRTLDVAAVELVSIASEDKVQLRKLPRQGLIDALQEIVEKRSSFESDLGMSDAWAVLGRAAANMGELELARASGEAIVDGVLDSEHAVADMTHEQLSRLVGVINARARTEPHLNAAFEKTLRYWNAGGKKAAATRAAGSGEAGTGE